jgi:hypothetical protein
MTKQPTIKELNSARACFQEHINEGKMTPGHKDDCAYCAAARTAIALIDDRLFSTDRYNSKIEKLESEIEELKNKIVWYNKSH